MKETSTFANLSSTLASEHSTYERDVHLRRPVVHLGKVSTRLMKKSSTWTNLLSTFGKRALD
jgi:hypothetical protein